MVQRFWILTVALGCGLAQAQAVEYFIAPEGANADAGTSPAIRALAVRSWA